MFDRRNFVFEYSFTFTVTYDKNNNNYDSQTTTIAYMICYFRYDIKKEAYVPHNKDWLKERVYQMMLKSASQWACYYHMHIGSGE